VILIIFFSGFLLAHSQFHNEAASFNIIRATSLLILIIYCALLPTKYQIFNDRIRIVLGWIFRFEIPFSNIENIMGASWQNLLGLNLNFINSYSSDDILQITRKHKITVNITPGVRDQFLENLNKAVYDWKRNSIKGMQRG
jgi:hypothetical protein